MKAPIALSLALCALACGCMKAPDPPTMGGGAPPRVAFAAPESWEPVEPDQDFFLAKWELAGGGLATLSWLGGGGEEFIVQNVQRWLAEWVGADGAAIGDYAFDTKLHGGRKTHSIELGGTLTATRQLGGGEPRADWRLFGAVVESEAGPVFLKLIGPAATVTAQTPACWDSLAAMTIATDR